LRIEGKTGPPEGAVMPLGFIPHRHMRRNLLLLYQPPEHRCRSIIGIANQARRFHRELLCNPFHHLLRGIDLGYLVGRREASTSTMMPAFRSTS
jgi:hypothetical protein